MEWWSGRPCRCRSSRVYIVFQQPRSRDTRIDLRQWWPPHARSAANAYHAACPPPACSPAHAATCVYAYGRERASERRGTGAATRRESGGVMEWDGSLFWLPQFFTGDGIFSAAENCALFAILFARRRCGDPRKPFVDPGTRVVSQNFHFLYQ